jgi:hypothetical protein
MGQSGAGLPQNLEALPYPRGRTPVQARHLGWGADEAVEEVQTVDSIAYAGSLDGSRSDVRRHLEL